MFHYLLPTKASPEVRAEQVRLLYHQGTAIQLLGILTAAVAIAMFWKVADHTLLLSWFCVLIVLSMVRLGVNLRFERIKTEESDTIRRWGNIYILGTFLSGLVWGSLALFFDPAWPAPYQVVLFVIYTGLIAGAFNTNSSVFIAFPAFYMPMVLFLMYVILKQQGEGFYPLLFLFAIYIVQMYISSLKFHNRLSYSLRIRFDNEQMADQLFLANEKLIELADRDELTQLQNRRSLSRYLRSEWNRHYINQKPISMLFLDVDYFKQYNDTYGHEAGDRCLILIADILRANAKRSNDMAARYGGEEFAVILPATESVQAERIAEQIHADLNKLNLRHEASQAADRVTISIGITTIIPQKGEQADMLLSIADKALYQVKENGRNGTVLLNPERSETDE